MATMTLHTNIPSEPLLTPLSHFPKTTLLTPPSLSPCLSSISPPCNPLVPPLPSLVLDLSLPCPQPLMSLLCSNSSGFTPLPLSHPTASTPPTKLTKHLLFHSPLPKGEGIKQALAWNREQLIDLQRLWELRQQKHIDNGLIPMTQPPMMISDAALAAESNENTAMVTHHSFQTPHSIFPQTPLESQCQDPFRPTAW
jgi:hypothetical protein